MLNLLQRCVNQLSFGGSASSLKQRVLHGTAWILAGYGASQILRFGGNLILTRLLYPELFGLMALVNTFLIGLALLSDVGIRVSIIQNRRGSETGFVNTAWTVQAGRGIALWLVSFVLAAPFAEFYGEPQLRWIIPVAALGVLVAGFNATSLFTLQRELRVGIVTRIELVSQASGLLVMIVGSALAPGVWALVVGGLASALVKLAASHLVRAGVRNRFAWDPTAAADIWAFGKWIFLTSAVAFFAEQSDRLILGKVVPLEILGVYGIALTFAELPRQITLAVSSNVLFPAFSSLRELSRPALRVKISRHRMRVLSLLACGLAVLAELGDVLVRFFYDARYWQATWMLPLLALGLWPRLLCNTIEPALFAIGKPQYTTAAQVGRVLWTISAVLWGFMWFGIAGAIVAIALNDLVYYGAIQFGLWREGLGLVRQDVQGTAVLLLFLGGVLGVRILSGIGLPFL